MMLLWKAKVKARLATRPNPTITSQLGSLTRTKSLPPVRLELTAFRLWDWRAAYCATEACTRRALDFTLLRPFSYNSGKKINKEPLSGIMNLVKNGLCDGRESNPGQLLGRQLCSPLYHQRLLNQNKGLRVYIEDVNCKYKNLLKWQIKHVFMFYCNIA